MTQLKMQPQSDASSQQRPQQQQRAPSPAPARRTAQQQRQQNIAENKPQERQNPPQKPANGVARRVSISTSKAAAAAEPQPSHKEKSLAHRLGKLDPTRRCRRLARKWAHKLGPSEAEEKEAKASLSYDDMGYAERQNSVGTFDLFKYATCRERAAICVGILCMVYAASWQPISVFILAIMSALMGKYIKQTAWLEQLNATSDDANINVTHTLHALGSAASSFARLNGTAEALPEHLQRVGANAAGAINESPYDNFRFLAPIYSFVTPIFDMGTEARVQDEHIEEAVRDILDHESHQFLRKSFEINGSAFVLALTQLLAFFAGLSLITWAARKQASRVKVLYFRSCLTQEVTWFEAIDSAGGAGSSLNALVERYEDGIGMKLALLCYFIGHVLLFCCVAFYQMAQLAAFCMPFVAAVGIFIAYLSEWQAVAIGQHALFAKRSLQLAEEIIAAIRTVFAFNGQQKEITRYGISLQPVYRKSLIKHLYTALNTSLSKFSIFACFACYCFYAMRLFPPYTHATVHTLNKAVVLAVMRGAEVSIVNILISIPFMEALQQSKGSIARIYAAIERRSKINPSSSRGAKPKKWHPSISFRMVQFGYADRSGPTRRRSTLPFLNLPGSPGSGQPGGQSTDGNGGCQTAAAAAAAERRRSIIDTLANELAAGDTAPAAAKPPADGASPLSQSHNNSSSSLTTAAAAATADASDDALARKPSAAIRRMLGNEIQRQSSGHSRRILNHFTLEIKPGQSVALVGPSGSGKSTVLSLVQRLYDITGGQLLIGQHSIKDLSVGWLRNQISVVTQEPRLFDMSIADNILLGLSDDETQALLLASESAAAAAAVAGAVHASDPSRRETRAMQQVIEAAQAASAHEFIARLPNGYRTKVGSGGVQLSGGQKQRIAIARALIRKPKILLLDESTSALDTESETKVQEALKAASKGRTTITVAHRLATIKHVDMIVVMSQGQVVECGSHDELMAKPAGLYREMYENQLQTMGSEPYKKEERRERSPNRLSFKQIARRVSSVGAVSAQFRRNLATRSVEFALSPSKLDGDNERRLDDEDYDRFSDEYSEDYDDDDDDDDEDDDEEEYESDDESSSSVDRDRASVMQLWSFAEMPKWSSLAAMLACLLSGLVLPANLIAHSYLFSAFAYNELEQISDSLYVFGLVMLSLSTFVFIVSFLQIIMPGYVGEKLSIRLRVKTMDSLLSKPMFYFDMDANSAGSLCDRFNSYIANVQSIAGTRVATLLESCSTLFAGAVFGFGQNLSLSMFCLSFALLVLFTTIVESRIVQRESSLQQKYDAQLAHLMADALSNIKTIASLNKEKYFIHKFSKIIEQREIGLGRWAVWLRTFLTSLKFVMPAMSWSASMYYGCHLLVERRIDLQTVFIVCPVVLFAVNDTFRALVFLPELLKARKSIERLWRMNREFSPEMLQTMTLAQQLEQQNKLHLEQAATGSDSPKRSSLADDNNNNGNSGAVVSTTPAASEAPAQQQPASQQQLAVISVPALTVDLADDHLVNRRLSNVDALPSYMKRKASRLNSVVPRQHARGRIEFRGVEFAYPNRPSALVLDNFSLNVAPGESVALVGGSGSGKSTCVSILEKFYDYHAGKVTLDGHDLRLVEPHWVRSQIGLVSQEPTLLSYTIGDNIRYGDNSRFVAMDEVVDAARTANIHDFIMSLPDQYDTELSTSAYSSSQLSGGQRQRIAIARALIRNAPILIFDEATSALDSRNETIVQDALNKARRGRTSLTIAHRLATIKDADKIVVMKDGRVVEIGQHDELLRRPNGHYRSLWLKQEGKNAAAVVGAS